MEFLILLGITVLILAISLSAMYFKVLFVKNGRFPQTAIGHNKNMHKRNITCPKHDALKDYKNPECLSCSGK